MKNIFNLKRQIFCLCFFMMGLTIHLEAQTAEKTPIYQPIENVQEYHHCGTMKRYNEQMQSSPVYRQSRQQIDNHAKKFAASARKENLVGGVIVIPVVFHVIYNPSVPAQNISDDQIKAQIKQLNDDYRRTNSDRTATPSAFQSYANDMEIQFCLATRDPSGNATTGITRHSYSSPTSWSMTSFDATAKPATVWDRDKYLNLWSANLSSTLLGYAQFPGDVAATDGVVLRYTTVGSIDKPGTSASFGLGRTASHEVGHWLNLYHIWGDDSGACTGSDQVSDTPNQAIETSGCGTFPQTDACTAASPGVMFMNYMDYSDDNCLNIFTSGQKNRMIATLNGTRSSLLTSNGCTPLTADYAVNANVGTYGTCAGATISYTILTTAFNSYATNISLATSDVPAGCTANLSTSTVSPGGSASVTVNIGSGVATGFYSFWIKTTSGASNPDSIALTFLVQASALSGTPTIITPTNNATGQSTTPLFTWNTVANATAYDFQLSTNSGFSNIILTQSNLTTNSAFVPTGSPLSNVTTYYWRVLAKNSCTTTAYATGSFTTGTITCMTFNNDSTKTISASGTPLVRSYIRFPHSGTITDINVTKLTGTHAYVTDLIVRLRSPTNTDVTLLSEPCDGETNFNIGFDDQTTNSAGSYPCPPTDGLLYQPDVFLTNFNGAQANGVWMLMVRDTAAQDGGSLTGWGLQVCVNNIVIPVEMVDFKAKPLKNRIQLNWQTATEQNNKGFEIQRSIDPLSNFTTIGFVKGQGNSSKLTGYQYTDEHVRLGTTYYYRLRQLDFEGKEMFSKIEAANLDLETVWDVAIEPNPTESVLNVEILGKVKQAVSLDLYAIDGKLILSKTIQTDHTKVALDLAPLSSGIYMLKCHAGTNFFVKKVVKK